MKRGKGKILLGLSGGVDSAVSAYLLKKEGYEVIGGFIKAWHPPFFPCPWKEDRLEAMRVAAHLDIPFLTIDLEKEYKKEVADYLIEEYRNGRTPNPDVFCNKEIKFGAFLSYALSIGALGVATGHYAQIKESTDNKSLIRGLDKSKDQSYFLWTLTKENLNNVFFPIGGLTKKEVRQIANTISLPNANRKDSQGICFIGPVGMKEFLSSYIKPQRGTVLSENGEVIGEHDGAFFLTLGERHGFTIHKQGERNKPYYVVNKNIKDNTVTVSTKDISSTASKLYPVSKLNLLEKIEEGEKIDAVVRYHGEEYPARLESVDVSKKTCLIIFENPIMISIGQSAVFYKNETLLGGGIIENPQS